MDTKITFHLNEQMVKHLKEEFEPLRILFKNIVVDNEKNKGAKKSSKNKKAKNPNDKDEAKRVLAKIEDLLSKLDNGGDFVCDNEALKGKDDVEEFARDLEYLLECGIGIV